MFEKPDHHRSTDSFKKSTTLLPEHRFILPLEMSTGSSEASILVNIKHSPAKRTPPSKNFRFINKIMIIYRLRWLAVNNRCLNLLIQSALDIVPLVWSFVQWLSSGLSLTPKIKVKSESHIRQSLLSYMANNSSMALQHTRFIEIL